MKSNRSIYLLLTTIMLLAFASCELFKPNNPGTTPPITPFYPCQELLSQIDEEHYILELTDSIADLYLKDSIIIFEEGPIASIQVLEQILQQSLSALLDTTVTDKIYRTCQCEQPVLFMEVDSGIRASDRAKRASSRLGASGNGVIKSVEINYIFPIEPVEPLASIPIKPLDSLYPIGFPIRNTAPKTIVAVIDSGTDYFHRDLKKYIWNNELESANQLDEDGNCLDDDIIGYNFLRGSNEVIDSLGHGTHVAGIIVDGLKDYPDFQTCIGLMSLKILEQDSASLFAAICAINYAVDKGADVINASWGYYAAEKSKLFEEAVENARMKEVFIVAAAGNDSTNIDSCKHWPASFSLEYDNVITVAALDNNVLASYSNYGTSVNLATQGTNIRSTFPYNSSEMLTGTSMAAPEVAQLITLQKCQDKVYSEILDKIRTFTGPTFENPTNKPIQRDVELENGPPYQ